MIQLEQNYTHKQWILLHWTGTACKSVVVHMYKTQSEYKWMLVLQDWNLHRYQHKSTV